VDAEVSLPLRHAFDGQLNLVLLQILGGQVKLDSCDAGLLTKVLHPNVGEVLALQ